MEVSSASYGINFYNYITLKLPPKHIVSGYAIIHSSLKDFTFTQMVIQEIFGAHCVPGTLGIRSLHSSCNLHHRVCGQGRGSWSLLSKQVSIQSIRGKQILWRKMKQPKLWDSVSVLSLLQHWQYLGKPCHVNCLLRGGESSHRILKGRLIVWIVITFFFFFSIFIGV